MSILRPTPRDRLLNIPTDVELFSVLQRRIGLADRLPQCSAKDSLPDQHVVSSVRPIDPKVIAVPSLTLNLIRSRSIDGRVPAAGHPVRPHRPPIGHANALSNLGKLTRFLAVRQEIRRNSNSRATSSQPDWKKYQRSIHSDSESLSLILRFVAKDFLRVRETGHDVINLFRESRVDKFQNAGYLLLMVVPQVVGHWFIREHRETFDSLNRPLPRSSPHEEEWRRALALA